MTDLPPNRIKIPPQPDWTRERDDAYVLSILSSDYNFDEALMRCFESLWEMAKAMTKALAYFCDPLDEKITPNVYNLIYLVEAHFQKHHRSDGYFWLCLRNCGGCAANRGPADE